MGEDAVRADLASRWLAGRMIEAPEAVAPAVDALLRGRDEIRVRLVGTEFQMRIRRALLDVPAGEVIGYGALAARVGKPGAARADGSAVGRNPSTGPCRATASPARAAPSAAITGD